MNWQWQKKINVQDKFIIQLITLACSIKQNIMQLVYKIKSKIIIIAGLLFVCMIFGNIKAQTPSYNVRVTGMRFLHGVGIGPTHNPPYYNSDYYRKIGYPGTLVELAAEMDVSGSWMPMYGDVIFTVNYSGATSGSFTVTVLSGQNIGTASIPYNMTFATGTTTLYTYTISTATGSFCTGTIISTDSKSIYWDNQSPPVSTGFPPALVSDIAINITTTGVKLFWTPVNTSTNPASGIYNTDFYEYRIYYREEGNATWKQWNGSHDSTLRGLSNNPTPAPADSSALHFAGSLKYTSLSNLKIFTKYEYYIAAVDVFGNETAAPGTLFSFRTQPFSITVLISDGITSFKDFTDLANPQLRTLRRANIKTEIYIVTSEKEPDQVRVWYTDNTTTPDIVAADNTINQSAFPEGSLYSVSAEKKGPNKWVAYLSTQSSVIRDNNAVRFIIETSIGGTSVFTDMDISDENPNDDEWTFFISEVTNFKPWPVRILNNVITNKNPVCYPSYYLSSDAYVSIKVYDIKGRPVSTILDNAFRRGGQNIKDKGWNGTNKSRRKLGIGLYYIHIKAERATDRKTILNKIKKVVIAR